MIGLTSHDESCGIPSVPSAVRSPSPGEMYITENPTQPDAMIWNRRVYTLSTAIIVTMMLGLLSTHAKIVRGRICSSFVPTGQVTRSRQRLYSSTDQDASTEGSSSVSSSSSSSPPPTSSPWSHPRVLERVANRKRNNNARFRQHVNPLARPFQQPTVLSEVWPTDVFDNLSKPLHLDIGCGKGGFLLDLAAADRDNEKNYLGLEIRPAVALYAKERIAKNGLQGRLDFLGCNANVDLERILSLYQEAYGTAIGNSVLALQTVTIQFPDPHFKKQHAKRRVVQPGIVDTLARFLQCGKGVVFLQSDVKNVLDDMREQFRACPEYFCDSVESSTQYLDENWIGIPTEREVSVLTRGLPVYRALFTRNEKEFTNGRVDDNTVPL